MPRVAQAQQAPCKLQERGGAEREKLPESCVLQVIALPFSAARPPVDYLGKEESNLTVNFRKAEQWQCSQHSTTAWPGSSSPGLACLMQVSACPHTR